MIQINLLGGIKKSIGQPTLYIYEELCNIKAIISYLENNYYSYKAKDSDILIAINGIEFSLLGGYNAKVSSGDVITILSVVHGG